MTNANREFLDRWKANNPEAWEESQRKIQAFFDEATEPEDPIEPGDCTESHRGPEGPNEDLAQCGVCWSPTFCLRPEGETFGWHIPDCSLPLRHESYCKPGGDGHVVPAGEKIRGYWPAPAALSDPEEQ